MKKPPKRKRKVKPSQHPTVRGAAGFHRRGVASVMSVMRTSVRRWWSRRRRSFALMLAPARSALAASVSVHRHDLGLLFLPFVAMIAVLALSATWKQRVPLKELIALHAPLIVSGRAAEGGLGVHAPTLTTLSSVELPIAASLAGRAASKTLPAVSRKNSVAGRAASPLAPTRAAVTILKHVPPSFSLSRSDRYPFAALEATGPEIHLVSVAVSESPANSGAVETSPAAQPVYTAGRAGHVKTAEIGEERVCVASPAPGAARSEANSTTGVIVEGGAGDFGKALAEAARAETEDFVIYNNDYRKLSYPMGDVSGLFGVCTDVVIRAYRALGIDLQALVHKAGIGSGDTNIDHRRTETLRKFFASHGEHLAITDFAEDYRPGDVVTYYRPQNSHSRSHIAVVADVKGPSGRLMIVHNRGWGPQMEDALFVDQITGHYRYGGPAGGSLETAPETGAETPSDRAKPERRARRTAGIQSRS